MKKFTPHTLFLLIVAVVAASAGAAKASDSLYDAGQAEYLKGNSLFDFGSKSKNIKYRQAHDTGGPNRRPARSKTLNFPLLACREKCLGGCKAR